jgi:tartrate-resistant acid phosphatase type 5
MSLVLSRRNLLKQTFAYSAAAMTGLQSNLVHAATVPIIDNANHFLMFGDWGDYDGTGPNYLATADQKAVKNAMVSYINLLRNNSKIANSAWTPYASVLLGDNFYGDALAGTTDPRWNLLFENMYPKSHMPGFWVTLGNHDYDGPDANPKYKVELDYAKINSRWILPNRWYRRDAPNMTLFMLDTNRYDGMSKADWDAQMSWLRAQLASTTLPVKPFVTICAHHPMYSNGHHGDGATTYNASTKKFQRTDLHEIVDIILRNKVPIDCYISGHDHDMQHMEFAYKSGTITKDLRTSFVISGGGGRTLYDDPDLTLPHGGFIAETDTVAATYQNNKKYRNVSFGFTHMMVNQTQMVVRMLNQNNVVIHQFTKTIQPDGSKKITYQV